MSVAADILDQGYRARAPLPTAAALQCIASAAHLRGVQATRQGIAIADIPAADLMRALRDALEKTKDQPEKALQVSNIVAGIAARLAQPGPVMIARSVLGICVGYAGPNKAAAPSKTGVRQGKRRADRRRRRRN